MYNVDASKHFIGERFQWNNPNWGDRETIWTITSIRLNVIFATPDNNYEYDLIGYSKGIEYENPFRTGDYFIWLPTHDISHDISKLTRFQRIAETIRGERSLGGDDTNKHDSIPGNRNT